MLLADIKTLEVGPLQAVEKLKKSKIDTK